MNYMRIDQAIQLSYLEPTVFVRLSDSDLKLLINKIQHELKEITRRCPQSQDLDQFVRQYRHALNVIDKFY